MQAIVEKKESKLRHT